MRVLIVAGGRGRGTPEQALTDDYLARAAAAGRKLGLPSFELVEVDERRTAKGDPYLARVPPGAHVVTLDERGRAQTSEAFARSLETLTARAVGDYVLLIGGSDGLTDAAKQAARESLAFGSWTWPHLLVRAMAAEQLYRAVTILSGHPYHRA